MYIIIKSSYKVTVFKQTASTPFLSILYKIIDFKNICFPSLIKQRLALIVCTLLFDLVEMTWVLLKMQNNEVNALLV